MKKILFITVCLLTSMFQFVSAQTDSELLQQKLAKFTTIDADFVQQVINPKGEVIQKSSGTLAIARPGNFHWQVTQPDQELIVSDGQDMWLYSPFIEQVTIMNFSDAIAGTPFALLSGADSAQWAQFNVVKKDQQFIVKSSDPKASTNTFIFIFNKAGNISEFVVQESQGQKSVFTLSNNKNNSTFAKDFFEFKIPNGIEIDDQR